MAEMIDREALKEALLERGFFPAIVEGVLESAPTVDAVPVVRCQECKYHEDTSITEYEHCFLIGKTVRYNDFCSYGDRNGGDGNG